MQFFGSYCIEMSIEAIEMNCEDGKLQNDTMFVTIEISRDKLFTSGKATKSAQLY